MLFDFHLGKKISGDEDSYVVSACVILTDLFLSSVKDFKLFSYAKRNLHLGLKMGSQVLRRLPHPTSRTFSVVVIAQRVQCYFKIQ